MRSAQRVVLRAFAKINLYLDITGTLPDGYHALETVMQSVELCDIVVISALDTPEIRLYCQGAPDIPCDNRNTAYKAAEAFLSAAGAYGCGVSLCIDKKIPAQAGLGGGSADAAAVLVGLNELFAAGFFVAELCEIGVKIGADVPFCVSGGTMLARGKGERLTALKPLEDCGFVIIKPPGGVDTASAYKQYDEKAGAIPGRSADGILEAISSGGITAAGKNMYNVFEHVYELEETARAKETLIKSGALGAVMTGTGSAAAGIFNVGDMARAARECAAVLGAGARVFPAKPVPHGVSLIYSD